MGDAVSDVQWLAGWYGGQVDGDWEHQHGITIESLDNPGWLMRVDLQGTSLRDRAFVAEEVEGDERWLRCWKDDDAGVFHAVGDPTALASLIACFRDWAEGA